MNRRTFENVMLIALVAVAVMVVFNQTQISYISSSLSSSTGGVVSISTSGSGKAADLSKVDVYQITSTAMAVAALFPELKNIKNEQDAIQIMLPTGTPEYSQALGGITFDDPVTSMAYLVKWYPQINQDVQRNDPQTWQRYLKLAAAPRGVSCEFCCGVGPQGITADGKPRCGCEHMPALLAVTLGLMKYTDYTDAEVLREVMRWKTMFFPKNMIALAMQVAGTDPSQLKDLPGMVGGC